MTEHAKLETIPTDSLVAARKLMTDSKKSVTDIAWRIVNGFSDLPAQPTEATYYGVKYISKEEYAAKKQENPQLALHSVFPLVELINDDFKYKHNALTTYANNVRVVDAGYEEIDEGTFVLGLTFDDSSTRKFAQEQQTAIDVVLDAAGLSPTDAFRQWRNNADDSLWLPVLKLATADPTAVEIAEDFSEALSKATAGMSLDFFDTQARSVIVNIPLPTPKF